MQNTMATMEATMVKQNPSTIHDARRP
jgi:hypothetical protein